jgi:uncharacterized membrane protein
MLIGLRNGAHPTVTSIRLIRLPSLSIPIANLLPLALLVILGVCGLAYPLLATGDRLGHRMESSPGGLSLAGYAWMDRGYIHNQVGEPIEFTGDYHAIEWLKENLEGNEVILEASIGPYRGGGSRISSATGLPTLLGWDSHQSQQRGSAMVGPRFMDIREIYQTNDLDRKLLLLHRYRVRYVVVGDVERYSIIGNVPDDADPDYYSTPQGIEAFDQLVGDGLEIAFQNADTIVYRVTAPGELGRTP